MRWGALAFATLSLSEICQSKVFISSDEALKQAFPNCKIESKTFYLTPEQIKEAKDISDVEVDSAIVVRYQGVCEGEKAGYAYVDSHRVRTQQESLLVVLNKDKTVRRVEILSFKEPTEYIPKPKWYEQFQNQSLSDELQIKKGISPVTGASLTARATTQAVRRILALDKVLSRSP